MQNEKKPSRPGRVPYDELSERILDFAVRSARLANALPLNRLGRHVAGQLIRSGTSAAPNYEEARAAESREDFIHKLSVALKELRESRLWLRLIIKANLLRAELVETLLLESEELCKIIGKSIVTAKNRRQP
ncbi:four helix bundle protein [Fontisphaera persica]|uniref:four helix bundle protein n=1 Tax=Fontisphaera persica TaxID=2974023 RepID=UPI0024BFC5DB|nr:four helix bundle protein [Fontisphaera persica]WCJ59647.1 four helix bundle protein [Fontisphaera persica]